MEKKLNWLLVLGLLLSSCSNNEFAVLFESTDKSTAQTVQLADELKDIPEEFYDLTIPYLRSYELANGPVEVGQVVAQQATYTSYLASYQSDGLKINGLLTIPTIEMPEGGFPGVVFVHGYIPPLEYETVTRYSSHVHALANQGIVVFKIDLRGHGTSEGEPGGAYFSGDYVIDTLNAYESLKTVDEVNPNKIGLWGHSMAGNIVLRAMAGKPEVPGVVIWAGAVYTYKDMREFGIADSSYRPSQNANRNRRQSLSDRFGEPEDGNNFWQLVAPTNYISDLQGKVQVHHASSDPVVTIEYSRNLKMLFDESDKPLELYEYDSGGHNIDGEAFSQAIERSVAFYKSM